MDVLLSLRVSSATVGLVRLESAVRWVIDAVRRGEPDLARERGTRCWVSQRARVTRSGPTSSAHRLARRACTVGTRV